MGDGALERCVYSNHSGMSFLGSCSGKKNFKSNSKFQNNVSLEIYFRHRLDKNGHISPISVHTKMGDGALERCVYANHSGMTFLGS